MTKKETKAKDFINKPYFEGGQEAFAKFILDHLVYPPEALAHGIEGTVHVHYDINEAGKVIRVRASSQVGYGCEEEAMRLVQLLEFRVPKNTSKLKLVFHKDTHIHFRLPKPPVAPQPPANAPVAVHYQYISHATKPTTVYEYRITRE